MILNEITFQNAIKHCYKSDFLKIDFRDESILSYDEDDDADIRILCQYYRIVYNSGECSIASPYGLVILC